MTNPPCKHPVVRVVSRHDGAEFVECQSCGDVFDSVEYDDMALEERGALADGEAPAVKPTGNARHKGRKQGGLRL